jgi:O-antigen ligase
MTRALGGSRTWSSPERGGDLGAAALQAGSALFLCALAGVVLADTADWQLAAGLLAGAALTALGMIRPALFVSLVLFIRPLLDGVGGARVQDIPSSNVAGALGIVVIVVTALVLATSRRFELPRAGAAMIVLLLVSVLAAGEALLEVRGDIGPKLISELVRLLALVAAFLLASQVIRGQDAVKKLFAGVGLSGVIPAVYGVAQWIEGVQPQPGFDLGRIKGTFAGPLPFSAYLAVTALILISLPRGVLNNWVRLPALGLILTALVGTYTREGWILFLVGLLLIQWRDRKEVVLAVVAGSILVVAFVPNVRERVLPAEQTATGRTTFESFDWRVDNWRGLMEKYSERPLTGWGLKSTRFVNPRAPQQFQGQSGGGYEAHNTVVRALLEGGVLLLAAYVLFFAAITRTMYLAAMDRGWPIWPYARIVLFLWVSLAVIAVATDDPLEATAMMFVLFTLTGAIEGTHRRWAAGERDDPTVRV